METDTKYFSRVTYSAEDVVFFQNGLFGFEDKKKFILIQFENDLDSLVCFQSVENQNLAFIMINPFNFLPSYAPQISPLDLSDVGAQNIGEVAIYTICVIRDDIMESTANLRCPILINADTKKAKQIILDDTSYPFRFPFSKFADKEG